MTYNVFDKTCVLCPNTIINKHRLCSKCYAEYKEHMNEPWFLELEKQQHRQDLIDKREKYQLPYGAATDVYGNKETIPAVGKRRVGRPSLPWTIKNKVLELYDASVEEAVQGTGKRLTVRQIAKLMGNKLGYVSVYNILVEYGRFKKKG